MAAADTDAVFIGTHRMIYGPNVPHYWVERPDPILYRTEQMIHGVIARPGDRFILSRQRRTIQGEGPFDIHFMTTRQQLGWTRETVIFRPEDPSPYPVEVKPLPVEEKSNPMITQMVQPNRVLLPAIDEEETIRRIVIRPQVSMEDREEEEDMEEPPFRSVDPPSYWDEVNEEDPIDDYPFDEDPLDDNDLLEDDPFEDPLEVHDIQ